MRKSAVQLLLLLGVSAWFLSTESRRSLAIIDTAFADWLDANTTRQSEPASVALVAIDDESLEEDQWPWSPLKFLLFFQAAAQFGSEVTAIAPVLAWDQKSMSPEEWKKQPQYERILQEHIRKMPKILLGSQLGFPSDPDQIPALEKVPFLQKPRGDATKLPQFTAIEAQPKEEFRLSATLGFTNLISTSGVTRKVPLLFSYHGEVVPSFVLQAAMLWKKLTPDEIQVELGSHILLGDTRIPIDAAGNMLVDFRAPITRFGWKDLVASAAQTDSHLKPLVPLSSIKNKIILLGRTDRASRTLHFPTTSAGSSGELFAFALGTIQNKTFIHHASALYDVIITAALLVWAFFALRLRRETLVWVSVLVLIVYSIFAMTIFSATLVTLPILLPAGLILFTVIFRLLSASSPEPPAMTSPL